MKRLVRNKLAQIVCLVLLSASCDTNKEVETSYNETWGHGRFDDSAHTEFFAARRGDQHFLIVGGKETKIDGEIVGSPKTSQGIFLVYIVTKPNGKRVVVCGGREGQPYDAVDMPSSFYDRDWELSDKRFCYVGKRDGKEYVVCDGFEGPAYDEVVRSPRIVPDDTFGDEPLYSVRRGNEHFVVIGRPNNSSLREFGPYEEVGEYRAVRYYWLVYAAKQNDTWYVIAADKGGAHTYGGPYDEVRRVGFVQDREGGYPDWSDAPVWEAWRNGKRIVGFWSREFQEVENVERARTRSRRRK